MAKQKEEIEAVFLSDVLDDQEDMIVRFSNDGVRTFVNKAFCNFFKKKKNQVIGNQIDDLMNEEEKEIGWDRIKSISIKKPSIVSITSFEYASGETGSIEWVTKGIFDDIGKLTAYQTIGRDVTERVKNELKVFETKENLALAIQFAGMGEFHSYVKENQFFFSEDLLKIFGVTQEEFGGTFESYLAFVPKKEQGSLKDLIMDYIRNPVSGVFEYEHRIIRKADGDKRWLQIRCKLHFNREGKPQYFAGVAIDITDKKSKELMLLEKRNNLTLAMQLARIGEFKYYIDEDFTDWTDDLYAMFQIERGKYKPTLANYLALIPEPNRTRVENLVKGYIANPSDEMFAYSHNMALADGREIWIELRSKLHFHSDGRPHYFSGIGIDITKSKKEELRLKERRVNLSMAMQLAKIGEFKYHIEENYTDWNDDLFSMFSIDKESYEPVIENYINMIPEDDRESVVKLIEDYIENPVGEMFAYAHKMNLPDGRKIWIEVRSKLHFYPDGRPHYFSGIGIDVTESKEEELMMRKKRQELSLLMVSSKVGEFEWDIQADNVVLSREILTVLGLGEEEYESTFEEYLAFILPEEREEIKNLVFDKIEAKEKEEFEYEQSMNLPTGKLVWLLLRVKLSFNNEGKAIKMSGFTIDITERKTQELILTVRRENLSAVMMSAKVGEFKWDIRANKTILSKETLNILGLENEDLVSTFEKYAQLIDPAYQEKIQMLIGSKLAEKYKGEFEYEQLMLMPKGQIWMLVRIKIQYDEEENPVLMHGITLDITSLKDAEKKLRESEERLKLASEITKLGSFDWELEKGAIHWDKQMHEIFELNEDAVIDRNEYFGKTIHPEDAERIHLSFKEGMDPKCEEIFFSSEHRVLLPSGTVKYLKHHSQHFRKKSGEVVRIVGTYIDVTQQKMAEEQLRDLLLEVNKLKGQLEQENIYLKEEIAFTFNFENMVYGSNEFSEVLNAVEKVASTSATVLISGETGTGKELVARAIHNTSDRKEKPLIKVNCAAIPKELIESELFGHVKGSFTGAISDKLGKFELADGGTIFLDEIGEMPIDLQSKLLRALQEGEIEKVGGEEVRKVDVRVIAATNRDLKIESDKGEFRKDLYFRLNVFPVHIPPLRERVEDIPVLVDYFVEKCASRYNKSIKYIPDMTLNKMMAYQWPGNIRELENSVERAIINSSGDVLEFFEFPSDDVTGKKTIGTLKHKSLDEVQRAHILKVLGEKEWVIGGKNGAAEILGLKPSTLRDKMKKLKIMRSV